MQERDQASLQATVQLAVNALVPTSFTLYEISATSPCSLRPNYRNVSTSLSPERGTSDIRATLSFLQAERQHPPSGQQREKLRFPYIYVKTFPQLSLAVLIDTGCGIHSRRKGTSALELRDFILSDILSKDQANFDFTIVCTHCHFDHIGGIEAFANSGAEIVASRHDREFLRPGRREENSLCGAFEAETPQYDISHYAEDGEELQHGGVGLGLHVLHAPGHTPDSIAIYDEAERWLFVGDTCYQRDATMPWDSKW